MTDEQASHLQAGEPVWVGDFPYGGDPTAKVDTRAKGVRVLNREDGPVTTYEMDSGSWQRADCLFHSMSEARAHVHTLILGRINRLAALATLWRPRT